MKRFFAFILAALSLAALSGELSAQEYRYAPFTRTGTSALRAVAQSSQTLIDFFGYQRLKSPRLAKKEDRPYVLVIEILSVYPGTSYEDCLISEVIPAD